MSGSSQFVFLLLLCVVFGDRDGRWFNREDRTITKTVKVRQMITEATPSSCVVVQTSLPPCRHIRAAPPPIQPTQTQSITATNVPTNHNTPIHNGWKPLLQPSDPIPPAAAAPAKTPQIPKQPAASSGWSWDFFNFGAKDIVITKTVSEMVTTKYMDPNTVVTFSVKGCRPSRLPFDLPECQPPRAVPVQPETPERGIIVMAPIQFVPPLEPVESVKPAVAEASPPKDEKKEENEKEVKKTEGVKEGAKS